LKIREREINFTLNDLLTSAGASTNIEGGSKFTEMLMEIKKEEGEQMPQEQSDRSDHNVPKK
jgi:hypothetical protein